MGITKVSFKSTLRYLPPQYSHYLFDRGEFLQIDNPEHIIGKILTNEHILNFLCVMSSYFVEVISCYAVLYSGLFSLGLYFRCKA